MKICIDRTEGVYHWWEAKPGDPPDDVVDVPESTVAMWSAAVRLHGVVQDQLRALDDERILRGDRARSEPAIIRVVRKPPGQPPEIIMIAATLEALRAAIGGPQEHAAGIPLGNDEWADMFCNEEDKELVPNLRHPLAIGGYSSCGDFIRGTVLCCTHNDDGEVMGLTIQEAHTVCGCLSELSI